jgi:serine/threonine protein kinase
MTFTSENYGRPWIERELIISLYFYFQHRGKAHDKNSEYVKELAHLLGRTPSSAVKRLQNFAAIDQFKPNSGKGLVNVGHQAESVFHDWVHRVEQLNACASVYLKEAREASNPTLFDINPALVKKAFRKYEVMDHIGSGSYGDVFSVVDEHGVEFALKVIKALDPGEDARSRFRREMRVLKTVKHQNIIGIYEDTLDENTDRPAFIMDLALYSLTEYVKQSVGKKKRQASKKPLLPFADAVRILRSIFLAVKALHEHNPSVIHRDINPQNILCLADCRWVLADFSLAKFEQVPSITTTFMSRSSDAFGTGIYTPPEQWEDFKGTDHRADIYSLGVLMWELLCPEWPPITCEPVPPILATLIRKAIARDRQNRHQSIDELQTHFEDVVQKLKSDAGGLYL